MDFAGFLDTLIRTVKPDSTEDLASLASKNIFRTHVNRQMKTRLQDLFAQGDLKPWAMDYVDSLADSQISIETDELYDTMSDSNREHFYIFDIDGTLKENELNCLTHAVPNLTQQVRDDLIALNNRPNTHVLILTARAIDEIKESNIPYQEIPVITGHGREMIHGDRHEILFGEDLIPGTQKFVDQLDALMDNLGISKDQYLIRHYSGQAYLQFNENCFAATKTKVMKAMQVLMNNTPCGWSISDQGSRYIFFVNEGPEYDKGMAVKKIVEDYTDKITAKTNIYVLGDAGSDYKAMEAMKTVDLPSGARSINIAIGDELAGQPAVDVERSSYHVVAELLNRLAT